MIHPVFNVMIRNDGAKDVDRFRQALQDHPERKGKIEIHRDNKIFNRQNGRNA